MSVPHTTYKMLLGLLIAWVLPGCQSGTVNGGADGSGVLPSNMNCQAPNEYIYQIDPDGKVHCRVDQTSSGNNAGVGSINAISGDINLTSSDNSVTVSADSQDHKINLLATEPKYSSSAAAGITPESVFTWNTCVAWGDHRQAGYLTAESDPVFSASQAAKISAANIANWNTAVGWGDHRSMGYLTQENDPAFRASPAGGITAADISRWNQPPSSIYFNVRDYKQSSDPDDSASLQRAIDAACAADPHAAVFFPAGRYAVTSPITIGCGFLTLRGLGGESQQSNITYAPSSSTPLFSLPSGSAWVGFADLHLMSLNSLGSLIHSDEMGLKVENCFFTGDPGNPNALVYFAGSNSFIRQSIFLIRGASAYAMHNQKIGSLLSINSIISGNLFVEAGNGILVDKAAGADGQVEGLKITGNNFINFGANQIKIRTIYHVDISHNMLDQCGGTNILLATDQGDCRGVFISDNYLGFYQNVPRVGIVGGADNITTAAAWDVVISNNYIRTALYGIVAKPNSTRWIISNNSLVGSNGSGRGDTGILIQGATANGYFIVTQNIVENFNSGILSSGALNVRTDNNWEI